MNKVIKTPFSNPVKQSSYNELTAIPQSVPKPEPIHPITQPIHQIDASTILPNLMFNTITG